MSTRISNIAYYTVLVIGTLLLAACLLYTSYDFGYRKGVGDGADGCVSSCVEGVRRVFPEICAKAIELRDANAAAVAGAASKAQGEQQP